MRYARRVDENQPEIVAALRACGVTLFDASRVGEGFPDLLCAHAGRLWMVEIKDPTKPGRDQRLTQAQQEFHEMFLAAGVVVHVVKSADEAIELVNRRTA